LDSSIYRLHHSWTTCLSEVQVSDNGRLWFSFWRFHVRILNHFFLAISPLWSK
jgi:hypothetical protein